MKRTVFSGILTALSITAFAIPLWIILSALVGRGFAPALTLALLCALYLLRLFGRGKHAPGKIVLGAFFVFILIFGALVTRSTVSVLALAAASVLITRSWLYYRSLLSVIIDAGICFLAFVLGFLAYTAGYGILGQLWLFFLIQSLSALIPRDWSPRHATPQAPLSGVSFEQNYIIAQTALRQLKVI